MFARGYDVERFVVENEIGEVLKHFSGDPRALILAEYQLQRDFGRFGIVADVFSNDTAMRRKILAVMAPLDVDTRSFVLGQLSYRGVQDPTLPILNHGCAI